ncbi:MAG TPA: transcription termination/antitermination NusG family protein [Steroidobacteraceae bacterium]|nr:transcription termination/antitermination NusG family protein [Steroidobacteraceae bacterium]
MPSLPLALEQTASAPASDRPRWFLVLTKPASESVATEHLVRQGFQTYYPRLALKRLSRGRWAERIVALFPRYLFIRLDPRRQGLSPVRSTRGVAGIVRFGTDATVVPDDVVDGLIQREDRQSGVHRLRDGGPQRGAPMNLVGGNLAGLDVVFEREAGDERSVVLLSLLGRSTPVSVSNAWLVPA